MKSFAFALSLRLPSRAAAVALASLAVVQTPISSVAASSAITPGARIAIIGDSITEQKLYSKFMEAYLLACSGVPDVKVFQFGWGGERAEGFAARLENDLAPFKPTVATTCYGMNDGQYRPYEENSVGRYYETNMIHVVDGLRKIGVQQIVLGSPGAVDTYFFVRTNFAPLSGAEGYNQNLAKLRDIDRRLANELGTRFADVHQAMFDAMPKAQAALGTNYDVCGKDGFHPGPNGHLIMAYAFLRALGCDGDIGEFTIDMNGPAQTQGGHKVLNSGPGKAEIESTRYPFCFEGKEDSSDGTRSIVPFFPFNQELNRLILKVKNLQSAHARVTWQGESREFNRAELAAGVNLAATFPRTPFDDTFRKFLKAVANKQNFETVMIKGMVTSFRSFSDEAKKDPELTAGFAKVGERLAAQQAKLDDAARRIIVPIKHTLTVTAVP